LGGCSILPRWIYDRENQVVTQFILPNLWMGELGIGLVVDSPLSSFSGKEHQVVIRLSPCKFLNGRIKWPPYSPLASFWKVISNGCPILSLCIFERENQAVAQLSPFKFIKGKIGQLPNSRPSSFWKGAVGCCQILHLQVFPKGRFRQLPDFPHASFWRGKSIAQFSPFEFLKGSIEWLLDSPPSNFWSGELGGHPIFHLWIIEGEHLVVSWFSPFKSLQRGELGNHLILPLWVFEGENQAGTWFFPYLSQPHFVQVWGWSPTLGKVGDLESFGTPECSELDSKAQNTLHWECDMALERSRLGLQLWCRPRRNRIPQSGVMTVQSSESPTGTVSGLHFGSPNKMCHLDVASTTSYRKYYRE
jgi:hypothetical protein